MIAGTHSGVGKTTVATGLMAALGRLGFRVAPAKVGPDYIDPGYHRIATGRAGANLDPFLCGPGAVAALAARAAAGADLMVVEGVMGLFDGLGASTTASTAEVAILLGSPVVLVVDASAMSGSVSALVGGYDAQLRAIGGAGLGGIVLNRVGSDNHESILREALGSSAAPVLGVLRRDPGLAWRDRHLGLVPVVEQPAEVARSLERLAGLVARHVDLGAVVALARRAPSRPVDRASIRPTRSVSTRPVPVAVVGGPAFPFAYPDNLNRLAEAGAELVTVDPLVDRALPPGVRGLYACGGFPEVFAETLSANEPLLADVRRRVRSGLTTWAECGGLLWLAESIGSKRLCGALPARATMTDRVTVGYREAAVLVDNPVAAAGTALRGHELHYATLDPPGEALRLVGRAGHVVSGWAGPTLLASFLHLHLGADPGPAERFVGCAAGSAPRGGPGDRAPYTG
ncbi:MAG TPA: cobyrinate a,c-diamide synthase [Acidimicrobiales bacterium]